MRKLSLAGMLFATAGMAGAQAQDMRSPEEMEKLAYCRALTDPAERLACYDGAVDRLRHSIDKGEVVVVDRAEMTRTKRSLFGLNLPNLNLFGGKSDEIKAVEGMIASAQPGENSRWIIRLQDGAIWRQIDDRPLALRPRQGTKVVIVRAALGSFMMRIGNQPAIRVNRTN